jgi:hypothetical protein
MAGAVDSISNPVRIVMPYSIDVDDVGFELFGISAEAINGYVLDLSGVADSLNGFWADSSNALIEYRQLTTRDDIDCRTGKDVVNAVVECATMQNATDLKDALHTALTSSTNGIKTMTLAGGRLEGDSLTNFDGYTQGQSLGDFMVEWIASNLFGVPKATLAISNDTTIIAAVESNGPTNIAVNETSTNNIGDIAARLIQALYQSSEENLQNITEQVLEQDPTRFRDEDQKNLWHALKWNAGDIVFFKVNFAANTGSMNSGVLQGTPQAAPTLSSQNASAGLDTPAATFYIKVTLA